MYIVYIPFASSSTHQPLSPFLTRRVILRRIRHTLSLLAILTFTMISTTTAGSGPAVPPKEEIDYIPSTIRLGTNLLGLGIGPIGDEEKDFTSPKMSVKSR